MKSTEFKLSLNTKIDWEEIDSIEAESSYFKYNPEERRKIKPSVKKVCSEIDEQIREYELTEESFHQGVKKALLEGSNHITEALRTFTQWQSHCLPSVR